MSKALPSPPPPGRRVTATDVAARAGVSQPTVSLVLGGNPTARVASHTRERVLAAARELGYQPNLMARALAKNRSYTFGVVIPDLDNPFFMEVVSGAERVAAEGGYGVLLCDARAASAVQHVEALVSRMVDGIVLDAASAAEIPPDVLAGVNVVVIDEPDGVHPGIASDARDAGRLAAQHLIELGHRCIAFLGPATETHTFRLRERGFYSGLREAGLNLASEHLLRVEASVGGGRRGMRQLLALHERPTACFCANDLLALGALKACLTAGVAVPAEMSLVGCDDIEMARIVTPELTTVRIPAREIGARAARELLRRIDEPAAGRKSTRLLPASLIVRGTTAAAPPRP
jgi:LacI family transcriptional regulator